MYCEIRNQLDIPGIREVYQNAQNFEVVTNSLSESNDCYVFFSSHNIYFPNTYEEFRRKIILGNRFEWKRHSPREFAKIVFLRDVQKQWYLEGINSRINSIEALAAFLKQETQGLKVTCAGSSAGGYAATLLGTLLQAERIFNFCGQFSLWPSLEMVQRKLNPILVRHESDPKFNRYFDIVDLISSTTSPIFYFYAGRCISDVHQAQLVKNISHVRNLAFDSATHGRTTLTLSLKDLFDLSNDDLIDLHDKYRNKMIKPIVFSLQLSGLGSTVSYFINNAFHKLVR